MMELDELEQKKRKLLLEQEIAALERSKDAEDRIRKWGWWWIAPLLVVGVFLFLMGLFETPFGADNFAFLLFSALTCAPAFMKYKFRNQ